MEAREIRTQIKEIIANVAGLDATTIADGARFEEDLALDSLALLEIGVDIDYAFKLGVPDDTLRRLRSIPETVALVEQCLESAPVAAQAQAG